MTPERISWLAQNDPIISELALMWRAWAWTDRGLVDPRRNTETEVAGDDLERRALAIVYGLRLEGWSTMQRAKILAIAANRAIWSLGPAALDKFYEGIRGDRKRVRFPKFREAWRGLKSDWRTWTCKQ